MYLCTSNVAFLLTLSASLWKYLEQQGVKRWRESEDAQTSVLLRDTWPLTHHYLRLSCARKTPGCLYLPLHCCASLLSSTIIRSESAGKTGEMRKHTRSHTHDTPQGTGGNFYITTLGAQSPLWNKDICHCLLFVKSEPGWVLISCDCALRLSLFCCSSLPENTRSSFRSIFFPAHP